MGDWDLTSKREPLPYIEYPVNTVNIHPGFNIKTSQNDIAVLSLSVLVNLGQYPTIGTVCLPSKKKIYETTGYYLP